MARKGAAGKKGGKAAKGGSRKKARTDSYGTYVYRVLKQVHPDTGISRKAMTILVR